MPEEKLVPRGKITNTGDIEIWLEVGPHTTTLFTRKEEESIRSEFLFWNDGTFHQVNGGNLEGVLKVFKESKDEQEG